MKCKFEQFVEFISDSDAGILQPEYAEELARKKVQYCFSDEDSNSIKVGREGLFS